VIDELCNNIRDGFRMQISKNMEQKQATWPENTECNQAMPPVYFLRICGRRQLADLHPMMMTIY
jgi:hypothetical protein